MSMAVNTTVSTSLLLTTLITHCQLAQVTVTPPLLGQDPVGRHRPTARKDTPHNTLPRPAEQIKDNYNHDDLDWRDRKSSRDERRGGKYAYTYSSGDKNNEESDPGAVMYIIVVLVFYSTGVMVMIVRYLRTEKKELEEEVMLENFFKSMPDKRAEKEHRVNRMAIRAFHTLTSVSYDDEELEDFDVGSEAESESREQTETDDTSSQPLLETDL